MPSSLTTFGLPPLAGEMSEGQRGNAPNPRRSGGSRNPDGRGAGEFDRSRFERTHPLSGRRLPASSCGGGCSTSEGHEPSDDGGRSSKRFPEGRRSGDVGGAGTKTPTSLGKACELSPARNPKRGDASNHKVSPASGGNVRKDKGGTSPSIKRAQITPHHHNQPNPRFRPTASSATLDRPETYPPPHHQHTSSPPP